MACILVFLGFEFERALLANVVCSEFNRALLGFNLSTTETLDDGVGPEVAELFKRLFICHGVLLILSRYLYLTVKKLKYCVECECSDWGDCLAEQIVWNFLG